MNQIYDQVFRLDGDHFDKRKAIENSDVILRNLWSAKNALRSKLGEFHQRGHLSRAYVDAIRNALRAGHYIEDHVGFLKLKEPSVSGHRLHQCRDRKDWRY